MQYKKKSHQKARRKYLRNNIDKVEQYNKALAKEMGVLNIESQKQKWKMSRQMAVISALSFTAFIMVAINDEPFFVVLLVSLTVVMSVSLFFRYRKQEKKELAEKIARKLQGNEDDQSHVAGTIASFTVDGVEVGRAKEITLKTDK